jgi:hypothetical protein
MRRHLPNRSRALLFAAALAVTAVGGSVDTAHAQGVDINRPFTGHRPFQLDLHGGFTWWGWGAATGVRFGIPIVDNGFIDSINNAIYINFGLDFYWIRWRNRGGGDWEYNYGFGLPVTLHWEFYFSDQWSVFFELGGQFFIHPRWINGDPFDAYDGGHWFVAQAGASFHVNEWFLLTLRVGTPYVAFGLTFQL